MAPNDDDDGGAGQLPLKGVVLCCTSLQQDIRSKVEDIVKPMGAIHKPDLTADVTHLLVGNIATPKYRYVAKERPDIHVLHPDWIEAVRTAWIAGGDVDVRALETAHRLPAFNGLQICVTGFDDVEQRNSLSERAVQHGAVYHGDLTKIVTHLVAAAPKGAKYNAARQWGIPVVSLRWFEDSLRRGMALDEGLYDPVLPEEEQGKGAYREAARPRINLGKRPRDPTDVAVDGKRKLRRTVSSRLDSQSQDLWQDLSSREVSAATTGGDQWKDTETEDSVLVDRTELHAGNMAVAAPPHKRGETVSHSIHTAEGLFSGRFILLHAFPTSRADLLRKYLEPNGATIVHTNRELEDASTSPLFKERCLLLPHAVPGTSPKLPDVPPGTTIATEWWIERCIHFKRIIDPAEDPLSRPLWDVQIAAFSKLSISTTGFGGVDVRQVAEAVKLMGGSYQEIVTPHSSVLISGADRIKKEKAFYARKHRIPIVSPAWLWTCLEQMAVVPFKEFRVKSPDLYPADFGGDSASSTPGGSQGTMPSAVDDGSNGRNTSNATRLSNSRKRNITPSLPLQTSGTGATTTGSRPAPFVHEDDDDDDDVPAVHDDGASVPGVPAQLHQRSQPLREMSPNLSPRKASERNTKGLEQPQKAPTIADTNIEPLARSMSTTGQPSTDSIATVASAPHRDHASLTADLADLLSRSASSRPTNSESNPPLKRKNRPLGRNLSGISTRSTPNTVSDPSSDAHLQTYAALPPPGTQLDYDAPDAEAHRIEMGRKLGMTLQDDVGAANRVKSLGVVRDSDVATAMTAAAGVAARVRGRSRGKVDLTK